VAEAVAEREQRRRELEKQVRSGAAAADGAGAEQELARRAEEIDGVRVIAEQAPVADPKAMMDLADRLKNMLGDAAIVLGGAGEGRVHLVVAVTPNVVQRGVKAGAVVKVAAQAVAAAAAGATRWPRRAAATPRSSPTRSRRRGPRSSARWPADVVRVLALDYGAARCGTAVSDPTGTLATPLEPILRPGTRKGLQRIAALVRELGAQAVVVGLPLSLSGADSAQTTETRAFAERLQRLLDVPVELYDERFTTRIAERTEGSAAADSRAAAVLLEDWLADGSRSGPYRAI
jgi:putative Holliday junction resolvase